MKYTSKTERERERRGKGGGDDRGLLKVQDERICYSWCSVTEYVRLVNFIFISMFARQHEGCIMRKERKRGI